MGRASCADQLIAAKLELQPKSICSLAG